MADRTAIRPALAAEADAVAALTAAAYAPWTRLIGYPPIPVGADYVGRIADGAVHVIGPPGAPGGVLVVEDGPDAFVIFSVAVAPEAQGQGLGGRLLDHAETLAAAAGHREVRLYTNARMTKNIALYRARGYRETARRPHPSRAGSVIVDMAKPIG